MGPGPSAPTVVPPPMLRSLPSGKRHQLLLGRCLIARTVGQSQSRPSSPSRQCLPKDKEVGLELCLLSEPRCGFWKDHRTSSFIWAGTMPSGHTQADKAPPTTCPPLHPKTRTTEVQLYSGRNERPHLVPKGTQSESHRVRDEAQTLNILRGTAQNSWRLSPGPAATGCTNVRFSQ